jgi:hypothetical protein
MKNGTIVVLTGNAYLPGTLARVVDARPAFGAVTCEGRDALGRRWECRIGLAAMRAAS